MAEIDWGALATAIGPVGVTILGLAFVLVKTGFLNRDDQGPGSIPNRVSRIEDRLGEVRDRTTVLEATNRELLRRVERLER